MDLADIICYIIVAGGVYSILLRTNRKPKVRRWYEVGSSDIANAERQKKKGK